MSIPGLKHLCSLPDGEVVVSMCLHKGRLIIACQNGLYELVRKKGSRAARFKPIPIDYSGLKRDIDGMVKQGEAQYRVDGSMLSLLQERGAIDAKVVSRETAERRIADGTLCRYYEEPVSGDTLYLDNSGFYFVCRGSRAMDSSGSQGGESLP